MRKKTKHTNCDFNTWGTLSYKRNINISKEKKILVEMSKYSLMVGSPRCLIVNGSAACISSCTYFHITSKLDPKHEESTIKEIPIFPFMDM